MTVNAITGLKAGQDLSTRQFHFVTVSNDWTVILARQQDQDYALGVVLGKPENGEPCDIAVAGSVVKVKTGAPVAAGYHVTNDTIGRAIQASTSGNLVHGMALQTASTAGDIIYVLLETSHTLK